MAIPQAISDDGFSSLAVQIQPVKQLKAGCDRYQDKLRKNDARIHPSRP